MKPLKILTVSFNLVILSLLSSCVSTNKKLEWPVPSKPEYLPVKFEKKEGIDDGAFISQNHLKNLSINIERDRSYAKKLEYIIESMNKHYNKGK